jgi:putative membrane protein
MKLKYLIFALALPTLGGQAIAAGSPADLNDLEIAHVAYTADNIDCQYCRG